MQRHCKNCGEALKGRVDQKFCCHYCRSSYHYESSKHKSQSFFKRVDAQLKTNRRILAVYNKGGKSQVRKEILLAEGFHPRYFTHYWKANNGNTYLFAYEYGFMKIIENGREKYSLITWQDYMNTSSLEPKH